MSPRRLLLALAVGAIAALACGPRRGAERVAFVGGPVIALDAEGRVAGGLAIDGDRIAAVGSAGEVRAWAEDRGARIVELEGRAVVPGFIDAHGHFPGAGLYAVGADLNSPPIGDVTTLHDVVARLVARARDVGPGDWVTGFGYDDTLVAERRHPTRADLDRVSTDRPVAALHVSGHLAAVNSAGLRRLGIDATTPDPDGGLIRRDASGAPDGVLEEEAMMGLQEELAPGLRDGLRMFERAARLYLAAGVTTAQSGATPQNVMEAMRWLSRLGRIPLRLVVWPDAEAGAALLDGSYRFESDGEWLRLGAVKLIADGSIQGYTAYLTEPYFVPPADDPGYRGYPRIGRDALIEQVGRFHAAGWQVAVHGNGDAAIDDILDAFAAAQRAQPRADARHVVVHAQMARDDQLDRMAELGVIPSFFVLHTWYWGDRHRDVFLGPRRAARISPARSAERRGLRFTIHCDAPVVPMEPLRLVWSAVNRRSTGGDVIGPGQRIGVERALRAVTIDAARQHFEEDVVGSLEPGKFADFAVLSASPFDDPARIDEIRVVETWVAGVRVHPPD